MNNVVILALKRVTEITNTAWLGTVCMEGSLLVINCTCTVLIIEPQPVLYTELYTKSLLIFRMYFYLPRNSSRTYC